MKIQNNKKVDVWFLTTVLILTFSGFLIFLSATMGLMARGNINIHSIIINQATALILGIILMFLFSNIHYRFWRKYSLFIFIGSILITLLVFIPGLGITSGGATRWLNIGFMSIQPAELLKLAFIIYCSAWLSGILPKIQKFTFGILPLVIIFSFISIILFLQRDTSNLVIIITVGSILFYISGARWRDILILLGMGVTGILILIKQRPYIYQRIATFLERAVSDTQGSGYQIDQSLIAVGSGEIFGKGFGQSIQKFVLLPEAATDSIFAVAAEELGFIGAIFILTLFTLLAWRGITIALKSQDNFARLLVIGIVTMITVQAFINIAGMIRIFPLSGTPLPFISLGGTALIISLAGSGIILNISRYTKLK